MWKAVLGSNNISKFHTPLEKKKKTPENGRKS